MDEKPKWAKYDVVEKQFSFTMIMGSFQAYIDVGIRGYQWCVRAGVAIIASGESDDFELIKETCEFILGRLVEKRG
jgi:hypothetical protein